jgi:hypothetical protein
MLSPNIIEYLLYLISIQNLKNMLCKFPEISQMRIEI